MARLPGPRSTRPGSGCLGAGQDGRPVPFDGVGYHLYVHENATDNLDQQAIDLDNTYRTYLAQTLDVIRKHEGQDKPLYVSETGWFSNGDNRVVLPTLPGGQPTGRDQPAAGGTGCGAGLFVLPAGLWRAGRRQVLWRLSDRTVKRRGAQACRRVAAGAGEQPHLVPTCERPPVYDSATYIEGKDAVADETAFAPGMAFQQVWFLRNDGTTTWGPGYTMVCVGGDRLGAPERVELPACAPGQATAVAVAHVAPAAVGRFTSVWQACNAQGQLFGQRVWTIINVVPVPAGIAMGEAGTGQWLPMTGSVPVAAHTAQAGPGSTSSVRTTRTSECAALAGAPGRD